MEPYAKRLLGNLDIFFALGTPEEERTEKETMEVDKWMKMQKNRKLFPLVL